MAVNLPKITAVYEEAMACEMILVITFVTAAGRAGDGWPNAAVPEPPKMLKKTRAADI